MLYQADAAAMPIDEVAAHFWEDRSAPEEVRAFAERLARGTTGALQEIDPILRESVEHWRLDRLAIVDRNVLRMAVYELLHAPETPPIVVIDEAIEVARKFGGEDSWQFTNGILDAVFRKLQAAGRSRR
jgi:N utilization substance protein B